MVPATHNKSNIMSNLPTYEGNLLIPLTPDSVLQKPFSTLHPRQQLFPAMTQGFKMSVIDSSVLNLGCTTVPRCNVRT
jgi:hypothetical protein